MATDTLPSFAHMDPNALNAAAAADIKVLSMINKTMGEIRSQENFSIAQGIKAAFGIAAAMMSQGIFSAMSSGIGAMGSMRELSKAGSVEKKLSSEMQEAKTSEENLTKEINEMPVETKLTDDQRKSKMQKIEKRNQAKDKITEHTKTADKAAQDANMKTNIWNMTTTGGKALSDGIFNTLQEQQKAVQSVASALQQMFGGSYTKAQQVLSQYLNIDFFKALQALATSIQ